MAVIKKKGKRGRPKGSKNKATLLKEAQERLAKKEIVPPPPPPKAFKILGYCKCGSIIGTMDFITKFIYKCPKCSVRARKKELSSSGKKEEYANKKDYMEHTLNAEFHDMPPLSDELDPKDVKVKE